ncbi:MAG: NAD(P)H-binding protein [Persicimonas sp.]
MISTRGKRVVVAGASGFVGRGLPEELSSRFELIGLSRDPERTGRKTAGTGYRWRKSDLFFRAQTRRALRGADAAVYLVHSLLPSARLTQGQVGDLDIICADNFGRAAEFHGLDHIVHLSHMPAETTDATSDFLSSRPEVEATLASYRTPVTTLRASMVVGAGGSVTDVLSALTRQLPAILSPRWARTRTSPIARADVVALIAHLIDQTGFSGRAHHIGGPEAVTFERMLRITADLTGRDRRFLSIPVRAPGWSARALSLLTGRPRAAMRLLVDSLRADTSVEDHSLFDEFGLEAQSVESMLREAHETGRQSAELPATTDDEETAALVGPRPRNEVRAVHRLEQPTEHNAAWVSREYRRWLPQFFGHFIEVRRSGETTIVFGVRFFGWPLLKLEFDDEASTEHRQLYWIRGGLLARGGGDGRLEFREILGGRRILAAIHGYRPRLPWVLYLATQARIHHFTMRAFNRHLTGLAESTDTPGPARLTDASQHPTEPHEPSE